MTLVQKRLVGPSELTTSTATLYTTPSATTTIVKEFLFSNKTAAARTITLRVVPSGATESNIHDIFSSISINANETLSFACSIVLNTGDLIKSFASANTAVNITANGYEEL